MTNELTLKTETIPAAITANFEEVRKALAERLERYDVVVTADGLKDAKSLATELNKMAGELDKRRKEEVAKASAPVRDFDDRMKELVTMCKEGRRKLIQQVEKYEDETREVCRGKLSELLENLNDKHGIDKEFRLATYDDLALVSNITDKGNLTAKAKSALESRVLSDKAVQDQTERRILELENASYKAGLSAPLTRDHVHRILFLEDSEYRAELDKLLEAEVAREKVAQERMRERMREEEERRAEQDRADRERIQKEEERKRHLLSGSWPKAELVGRAEREQTEAEQAAAAQPEQKREPSGAEQVEAMRKLAEPAQPAPSADGMVTWEVTATFATRVKARISQAAIEAELRRVMEKAGITALESVTARARREVA